MNRFGNWRLVILGTIACCSGAAASFGADQPALVANVKVTSDQQFPVIS